MIGTKRFAFCLALLINAEAVLAYEVDTHEKLSEAAHDGSVIATDPNLLQSLGIKSSDEFSNSKNEKKTVVELIKSGSHFEDNGSRSINHFYDPVHNVPLSVPSLTTSMSPDWTLEDKNDVEGQDFSYKHARQYFYDALTTKNSTDHDNNYGKTFEALGHVIHHLQDMAQPQHVRNDPHCDAIVPCLIPGALAGKYNPSRYEKYTQGKGGNLPFDGYAPLYTDAASSAIFSAPRKLWRTSPEGQPDISQGMGLAEYTNRNFVSAGTNFDNPGLFPSPVFDPVNKKEEDIKTLVLGTNLSGTVTFYGNTVQDTFRPSETRTNSRASTESIFDEELKKAGHQPTFTLNRFNFDAAHEFLIPRAIAYSAGLIDYFFRGRLEAEDVTFTDTGISLRVKNGIDPQKTPAWANEILYPTGSQQQPSTLTVAFEYKDATGETKYGASNALPMTAEPNGANGIAPGQISQTVYAFTLSVPAEATEVKYRLVFRGRLGQEDDAVAVGPADPISGFVFNPSYIPADGITGSRVIYQQGDRWRLTDQQNKLAGNIDWKGWYRNGKPTKVLSWVGPSSRHFPRSYDPKVTGYSSPVDAKIFQNGEIFAVGPPVLGAALYRDGAGKEWLVVVTHDGRADIVYRRPNIKSNSPAGWQQIGRFDHDPALLNAANTPWFFNGSGTEAQTIRSGYKAGDPALRLFRLKISIADNSAAFSNEGNLDDDANVGAFTGTKTCEESVPAPGNCASNCTGTYTEDLSSSTMVSVQTQWSGSSIIAVDYIQDTPVFATFSSSADSTYSLSTSWIRSTNTTCNGRFLGGACRTDSSWEIKDTRHVEKQHNVVEKISVSGFGDIIMESISGTLRIDATQNHLGLNNTTLSTTTDKSGGGSFEHSTSRLRYLDLRYGLYSLRTETRASSGETTNVEILQGGPFGSDYAVSLPQRTTIKQVTGYNGGLPVHQIDLPENIIPYLLHEHRLIPECNSTVTNPGAAPRQVFMDPGVLFSGGAWAVDSNKNLFLSESKFDKDMRGIGGFNYLTGAMGEDPGSVIPTAPPGIYYYDKIGVVK